jgi:hypothetical protein
MVQFGLKTYTLNIENTLDNPYDGMINEEINTTDVVVVIPCYNATIASSGHFQQMICLDEDYKVYCKNAFYTNYVSTGECRFGEE